MKAILPFFLSALAVFAQPRPAAQAESAITGTVVSSPGNRPLANVEISVFPHYTVERQPGATSYEGITGADGAFTIHDVRPGIYSARAKKAGFSTLMWGAKNPRSMVGATLTVTEGGTTQADFVLDPQGVITGRVVDENGDPVMGAQILVFCHGYNMPNGGIVGGKTIIPCKGNYAGQPTGTTNDLGEFRIPALSPDTYFLRAAPPNLPPTMAPNPSGGPPTERRYAESYYPGAADRSGALPLRVFPGGEARASDWEIHKTSRVSVRGAVLNSDGTAPPAGAVMLYRDGESAAAGSLGPDGKFQIAGVEPGAYSVYTRSVVLTNSPFIMSGAPAPSGQTLVVGERDVDDVFIRLPATITVTGAIGFATEPKEPVSLEHIEVSVANPEETYTQRTFTAADGSFRIDNVIPGEHRLFVKGMPKDTYLASATAGGEPAHNRSLNLGAGAPLELVLGTPGAQLDVTALDGKGNPVTGATVSLFPASESIELAGQRHWAITSDQDGKVHFSAIPPGEYRILAWETHLPGEPQDPEFRRPFLSRAVRLQLDDRAREARTVTTISAEAIANAAQ